MEWTSHYQLFLFDFDGLLVNTEQLHFEAYRRMCEKRGCHLDWDFHKFCSIAHKDAVGLKEAMFQDFPSLEKMDPTWQVLYGEKKNEYQKLIEEGNLELMPGVAEFLDHLQSQGSKRCVVTNSTSSQIEAIKRRLPKLQTISHWITRECYKNPKPAPDGYLKAIADLAEPGDRIIGFEDTLRGYLSLEAAEVEGVLISDCLSLEFKNELMKKKAPCFSSFVELKECNPVVIT